MEPGRQPSTRDLSARVLARQTAQQAASGPSAVGDVADLHRRVKDRSIAAVRRGLTNYHLWPPFLSRPAAAPTGQLLNPSLNSRIDRKSATFATLAPRFAIIFCLFCLLTQVAILPSSVCQPRPPPQPPIRRPIHQSRSTVLNSSIWLRESTSLVVQFNRRPLHSPFRSLTRPKPPLSCSSASCYTLLQITYNQKAFRESNYLMMNSRNLLTR